MAATATATADIIVPDDDPHSGEDPAFLTEDAASSTQSLSSSVLNYQYENGRRYHAFREGAYVVPNDNKEQERMDLHHHISRLIIKGDLFRAPIDPSSARILDLGTGTGIWAIEMADDYPKANVTGTDLSPIQPGWVPPNCSFEVDDFESDWDFSRPFDFIHGRYLTGAVQDFPRLFQRIKNNLNPSGWVEMVENSSERFYSDDNTIQNAPNLCEYARLLNEASSKFGKPLDIARHQKQFMIDAGFTNVREEVYKIPNNPWPKDRKMKDLGRYQQVNFLESLDAWTLALLTRVLGWKPEEVQAFLPGVRQELMDRSLHCYIKCHFVYGQKPE